MKIGLVTPYFPDAKTINSGIANHFWVLAKGLAEAGHEVVVVHIRPQYAEELECFKETRLGNNVLVITFKTKLHDILAKQLVNNWALADVLLKLLCIRLTAKKLPGIIKRFNLDVIETSSYFSLLWLFVLKRTKTPVAMRVSTTFLQIMTEHYPFKSRLLEWFGKLEINLIKKSRHLITHTANHASELEKLYQIPESRFTIIPHGIPLKTLAEHTAAAAKETKIMYAGRFEYRKGIDTLLEAIPIVIKQNPSVTFELIGGDDQNGYITKFKNANPTEVVERVNFRGVLNRDELDKAYSECDFFVAPSRYESFGLIYIEAMSYGKPVIGCGVGGAAEIIQPEYNGLLAEAGNATDLSVKILELAADKEAIRTMGKNARASVEERFSQEMLITNSVYYYNQILSGLGK